MVHLLLFKNGGGENDALAAVLDSSAQKEGTKVLLDGAGADIEFGGDFFVAAALYQKIEDLLIAARDFDLIEVEHDSLPTAVHIHYSCVLGMHVFRQTFATRHGRLSTTGIR
jgi:hypothetical protein